MSTEEYISGETLSRELGVSRTAVWKAVNKLKEEGYKITSVRNKGYHLEEESSEVTEDSIKVHLDHSSRFRAVKVMQTVDSTITEAKRLRMNGKMSEGFIMAEEQTAGKGRRGRSWVSAKGDGIWSSLLLTPDIPPDRASMLTLLAGLAVVRAIKDVTGLEGKIKWPNDVVIEGKKVCGILTEMSAQLDYINYVVVGIGINVNQSSMDDSVAHIAASLSMLSGGSKVDRLGLLIALLQHFEELYESFLTKQSLSFIMDAYNAACINVGMDLKVEAYGEVSYGKGMRVDEEGRLIVRDSEGHDKAINAGEVSVRGLYGYAE